MISMMIMLSTVIPARLGAAAIAPETILAVKVLRYAVSDFKSSAVLFPKSAVIATEALISFTGGVVVVVVASIVVSVAPAASVVLGAIVVGGWVVIEIAA